MKTRPWMIFLFGACLSLPNVANAKKNRRDPAAESLRNALAFYEEIQYGGGWASHYSPDLSMRWGEWRPTHPNVVTIQDSGTTGIGLVFVAAANVLEEPNWLAAASKTGDLLIKGQLPNGGFTQELQITADRVRGVHQLAPYPEPPRPDRQGVLENNATDRAIELLLQLFDATGEQRFLKAARQAVDFLVAAQYRCGAFPQRYPSSEGYDKYYTLNDGATTDSILRLVSFYRRTGKPKYLRAARKGGDWLVSAVLPDPTPGWAEQYDHTNTPAKARSFEPPGAGTEITVMAVEALTELYLLTGDKRFLDPVQKAWNWLESTQISPKGPSYRLYEIGTGKPIFVEKGTGTVRYDIELLPEDQRNRWQTGPFFSVPPAGPVSPHEVWQRLQALDRQGLLAQRRERTGTKDIESGYGAFRTPAIETEEDLSVLGEQVDRILAAQTPEGWWQGTRDGAPTISSAAFVRNARRLLAYLKAPPSVDKGLSAPILSAPILSAPILSAPILSAPIVSAPD